MKIIAASTSVDKHGMRQSKENLENIIRSINESDSALPIGLEHDIRVPPMGICHNAEMVELESGEFAMTLDQSFFDDSKEVDLGEDGPFKAEWLREGTKYLRFRSETQDRSHFAGDPMNLGGIAEYRKFIAEHRLDEVFDAKNMNFRKAVISDPETWIHLSKAIAESVTASIIVVATLKEAGKALGKAIGDDLAKIYQKLKEVIRSYATRAVPKNRPQTWIVSLSLPELSVVVELVLVDPDPDCIDTMLAAEALLIAASRAKKLKEICSATKVQFTWDSMRWKVFYILTDDGKVLSSPDALAYRSERLKEFQKRVEALDDHDEEIP